MNDIEKAALKTYLWWKNRYFAIQNALPEDNLYSILAGSPSSGICAVGEQEGADPGFMAQCASLADQEISIRSLLKDGNKATALILIKDGLDLYQNYLTQNLGQQFIDDNQEAFTWRSNAPTLG